MTNPGIELVIEQAFRSMEDLASILSRLEKDRGKEAKIALIWLYNLGSNQQVAAALEYPDLIADTLHRLNEVTNSARQNDLGKKGVRLILPIANQTTGGYEVSLGDITDEMQVATVDLTNLSYVPRITISEE